jgi:PST family polysaccharide transporter
MKSSFKENLFSLFGIQIFAYLLPILLIPYLIGSIGLERIGEIAVSTSACTLLSLVVEYGFTLYGARRLSIAKQSNDKKEIADVFSEVMQAKIIVLLLLAPLYFLCLLLTIHDRPTLIVYASSFLIVVGQAFSTNWFFQGLERMRSALIHTITMRMISVLLIISLVKNEDQYYFVPLIQGIATLLISFLMLRDALRLLDQHVRFVPLVKVRAAFVKAAPLFGTSIMSSAIASGGVVILASFSVSNELIGVYSTFDKIIKSAQSLFGPVTQALFPMSARLLKSNIEEGKKLLRKSFITLFILSSSTILIIFLASEILVGTFLSAKLAEHSEIVLLFAPWFVAGVCNNITGTQYLVASGQSVRYLKFMVVGAIMSFASQIILIPFFDIRAVAIGMSIGEVFLFALLIRSYLRFEAASETAAKL